MRRFGSSFFLSRTLIQNMAGIYTYKLGGQLYRVKALSVLLGKGQC